MTRFFSFDAFYKQVKNATPIQPWRLPILHKRFASRRALQKVGYVFVELVLPYLWKSYMINGKDYYRLQLLSSSFLRSYDSSFFFTLWLQYYEKGRGIPQYDSERRLETLYREFHGSILLRLFINKIQRECRSVAIAGSFAMCRYLEDACLESFEPGDIDIFIAGRENFWICVGTIDSQVLDPLGLSMCDVKKDKEYDSDSSSERRSTSRETIREYHSNSSSGGRSRSRQRRKTRRRSRKRTTPWRLSVLTRAVEDYANATEGLHTDNERRELTATSRHIPFQLRPQRYRVLHAVRVLADDVPSRRENHIPQALRPLNVVLIEGRHGNKDVPSTNFATFVCSSFDILPCSIALVGEGLYDFKFQASQKVFQCLRDRELHLTEYAFSCNFHTVNAQMSRILKYIRRGFSWKAAGS